MLKKLKNKIAEILLLLLTLPIILPMYMLVINSFKSKAESANINMKIPTTWNIVENYTQMARTGKILSGYKNSFIITLVSVVLIVILSALTAFIIQRRKHRVSGVLYLIFVLGVLLPSFTVPTVLLVQKIPAPRYVGLILIYIATNLPMGIFLYTGYYKSIPRELDEAAMLDGCAMPQLFIKIIFPLVKPMTATFAIITILGIWNDFSTPLYLLSGSQNQTVTLAMFNFFGPHAADWNLVFACIVASTIPVVIMYLLLQKYIIAGMVGGSVKG